MAASLMNIQEFATLAEAGMNVKGVLMNNARSGWCTSSRSCSTASAFCSRFIAQPDFLQIARVFALPSWTWTSPPTRALRSGRRQCARPGLIHASIDAKEKVHRWCRRAANKEMIGRLTMTAEQPHRPVLEIDVNNHPGVMSHVVGLFSRRAYNVEGIICAGGHWRNQPHLVADQRRRASGADRQTGGKAEDVLVVRRHDAGHPAFAGLERYAG